MSRARDVVVIGGGTNGLACAGLLAKAGRDVLVLERREILGGLAAPEEFHPGYRSGGLLHDTTGLRSRVFERLDLARHGLRLRRDREPLVGLGDDRRALRLHGDAAGEARSIAEFSPRDAESLVRFRALLSRIRPVMLAFLDEPAADLTEIEAAGIWWLVRRALKVRGLGRAGMMDLMRLPPMSLSDFLGEWFESDRLKAALAMPALSGGWMGPRSPGGGACLLRHEALAGHGVEGGPPALVAALEAAARAHGAEIRTGAEVSRLVVSGGSIAGVEIKGGETIAARAVAASCDPKQLFQRLLPAASLTDRLGRRIAAFRQRGTTAHVLLALKGPPRFAAHPDSPVERAVVADNLDRVEQAFDAVKYRTVPAEPVLEVHVPTVSSPDLAPEGGAVVSVLAHFVPQHPDPRWDDERRARLGDRVVEILERHAPGISASILSGHIHDPVEIEKRHGITGGHIHHGEQALDQLLIRPAPECAGHRTPISGLWLCGSGSHPGGGITCGPGALAAAAIAGR